MCSWRPDYCQVNFDAPFIDVLAPSIVVLLVVWAMVIVFISFFLFLMNGVVLLAGGRNLFLDLFCGASCGALFGIVIFGVGEVEILRGGLVGGLLVLWGKMTLMDFRFIFGGGVCAHDDSSTS